MQRSVGITEFVRGVEELASKGFPTSGVHQYLLDTVIDPESLAPYLSFRPDRYTRNLIHKTAAFELLAIGWDVGQRAPIHGHEGERCWARVEEGSLRFTNYRELSETPLQLEPVGNAFQGERGHLDGPADIHAVENPKELGRRAVSLHLYSFPFPECDIYDLASGVKRRVRLLYDTVDGKPASA